MKRIDTKTRHTDINRSTTYFPPQIRTIQRRWDVNLEYLSYFVNFEPKRLKNDEKNKTVDFSGDVREGRGWSGGPLA